MTDIHIISIFGMCVALTIVTIAFFVRLKYRVKCPDCRVDMVLAGKYSHNGHLFYRYVCPKCGYTRIEMVY